MNEDSVSQLLIAHARVLGATLLRNNSGALKDHTGRVVRYGHGNISKEVNDNFKSSDYIGITPVTITEDMVGQTLGVFTAIEMKKGDWVPNPKDQREIAQANYHNWVLSLGGFAGFANCIDHVKKILKK